VRSVRPLSITVVASSYIVVGVVGFAYHVTDLGSEPALQAAMILAVRLLAVVIGVAMLRGIWWARPAALAWLAYHVVLGVLHSWGDALMHLLLLTVFMIVLLRPAAAAYFRRPAGGARTGA
jgi:hypothetical protein